MASILWVNTGWTWLDVAVYVVSGIGFVGVCYNLPGFYRNVVRPQVEEALRQASRRRDDQNQ